MMMGGTAAAERSLVVVLDATGSMTQVRTDGKTRFEAAVEAANDRLLFLNAETAGIARVAVYKFYGTGIEQLSNDGAGGAWVTPFDASEDIANATVTFEATPLAGSMCDTVDIARASVAAAPATRFLEVFTDGDENNTLMSSPCFGPASLDPNAPFDMGSWQNKVWVRTTNPLPAVTVGVTLYTNVSFAFASAFGGSPAQSIENGANPAQPTYFGFGVFAVPVSDAEFFSQLAAGTGGNYVEVQDDQPAPVVADLDGDFDVDRDDAIALARQFGSLATSETDLDGDGSVGYGDYVLLLSRFGNGTGTPAADPYTQGTVITCHGAQVVTVDGLVIESGGLTIQGTGACSVVIRNSLIVSGSTAITTRGVSHLQVDNSIIVGEAGWLNSTGVATLSAAGSVFHGKRTSRGAFVYSDRGGNTFE
jgi:hypothetical protein